MLSHEVRQPVAQILGTVSLFEDDSALGQENSELIANLKTSAANLDIFTKKLTTFMNEMRPQTESDSGSSSDTSL